MQHFRPSPSAYPPHQLADTSKRTLNILQLTDLHLMLKDFGSSDCVNIENDFQRGLVQALSEGLTPDLIIVTGDLVHEMDTHIYDYIFKTLDRTGIPFACISGNHDVTDELGQEFMAFEDYVLIPHPADERLLSNHLIESKHWQILLLDSSASGEVKGILSDDTLQWLDNQLSTNNKPAVICLHHHVLSCHSAWLDNHILINSEQFLKTISPYPHAKLILHGHIHQEMVQQYKHIKIFGTPAMCYQFKPNQHDFALDYDVNAGYRWVFLHPEGTISTQVKRLP